MESVAVKITGNKLSATEFNQSTQEAMNFVESAGLTLTGADWYQLAKGVAAYAASGDFYYESGTTNNYILTPIAPRVAPTSYLDGMSIRFRTSNINTGASTINVNSLGSKSIKKADGTSDLSAGDIPASEEIELIYNLALDVFTNYSHKYSAGQLVTGDVKASYDPNQTGYVVMDDGTIGDLGSGATTRANADTKLVYKILWDNITDVWAPVSTGRGASANADFDAGKTLTLPRQLGRAMCCEGMGSGLSNRSLGEYIGEETHQLIEAELASHNHIQGQAMEEAEYGRSTEKTLPPWRNTSELGSDEFLNFTSTTGGDVPHNNIMPSSFIHFLLKL